MSSITANFTVTVSPGATAFTITPNGGNLPGETVGVPDQGDKVCDISGGQPPYSFQVTQGTVPPGMQLTSEANADQSVSVFIEGTPTQSGAFSFGLTVSDSAGAQASTTVTPRGGASSPAPANSAGS